MNPEISELEQHIWELQAQLNKEYLRIGRSITITPVGRWAKTLQNSPSATKIQCNLLDEGGVEITEGNEAGVDVYCVMIGGGNLDQSVPRLITGNLIPVELRSVLDEEEEVLEQWWCPWPFNRALNCSA